ncbi:MAG: YjbQ family protein [Candidatus Krumholzibacteria bacterium]|nr:YjbQ family protein [Candidatus Krumholzibacteria bacterium]MDH4336419.1 YjbQ family protein [Candidatus Krumholzibacteria bacterium]MDH5269544.1 YjbQ family protein [Candidatus Krumholzibacteria bacterium]
MKIETARLQFNTDDGASLSDVTAEVNAFVRDSAFQAGLCILTVAGDGCCLTLAPDLDDDMDDLLRIVRTHLATPAPSAPTDENRDRLDVDDSGYPAAGVVADSITLTIRDGGMNLGSWDGVILLDARGPRPCPVDVTLMGA